MRKNIFLILTLMMILALPVASYAQNDDAMMEDETEVEVTSTPAPSRMQVREKIEERQAAMEEKRTQLQADLEARREEAQQKFEERRQEFEDKLAEIKDERKQAIIERTDERLKKLNETITDRLLSHLEKISEVLDRIETKAAEVGDASVDDAITAARDAIETSQAAIEEQAGQEYIVTIGDEDELKTAVQDVVEAFRTDMKATAETVKEARDMTATAARTLGALMDETKMMEDAPEGEESGS